MTTSNINKFNAHPSFGKINSVKCSGLYKKDKEAATELVKALKQNPTAMDFCNKYNSDIVFFAHKDSDTAVESAIYIFFDNIAKSKTARFFQKLFGERDKISLSAYCNEYDVERSLKGATENLKNYILPQSLSEGKNGCGMLDSHISYKERDIKEVLEKRETKKALQESIKELKESSKAKSKVDEANLNDAINDLLNS